MKNFLLSLLFFCFSLAGFGQDVSIQLQPFTLEIPNVQTLTVRPLGALIKQYNVDSTQVTYLQPIYYELRRDDGRTVEAKNLEIPEQFADLLVKYQKGTLTASERQIINAYLQGFNSQMILKQE